MRKGSDRLARRITADAINFHRFFLVVTVAGATSSVSGLVCSVLLLFVTPVSVS